MSEHPILFSAPMVRAILEGRKTMTRRVIKPQPPEDFYAPEEGLEWRDEKTGIAGRQRVLVGYGDDEPYVDVEVIGFNRSCPYGQPGDRLWVRETFATLCPGSYEEEKPRSGAHQDIRYMASDRMADCSADIRGYRWRPSIYMPRWASRIDLEITAVRVERVQDISEYDAGLEGAPCLAISKLNHPPIGLMQKIQAPDAFVYGFYDLWNSINSARGYGWDANPWVWVLEFKRIEP